MKGASVVSAAASRPAPRPTVRAPTPEHQRDRERAREHRRRSQTTPARAVPAWTAMRQHERERRRDLGVAVHGRDHPAEIVGRHDPVGRQLVGEQVLLRHRDPQAEAEQGEHQDGSCHPPSAEPRRIVRNGALSRQGWRPRPGGHRDSRASEVVSRPRAPDRHAKGAGGPSLSAHGVPRAPCAARRVLRRPQGRVLRNRRARTAPARAPCSRSWRASTAPTPAGSGWRGAWRRSSSSAWASTRT